MQFRKDINGLRAIAVMSVVLFHFNPSWMPGGFAGVDVFFVISGFLMTGIVFRGIEKRQFSIMKFYIARANRIVPALAALCLVLMLLGFFYLSSFDYKNLGLHVASSIGFLSNVIYMRESGYFDAVSHEKWLLHTWSLSVEWQFYIIYPLVLVIMRKFITINAMKLCILLGTVSGFIFCVIATSNWPDSSYYLLSSRAWEMMLGGVAFLYPIALKNDKKKLLEWLGLLLIFFSYFFISQDNQWPGYLTAIPVLGSFLIIQAQCNDSFIMSNLLSQKLGTWSYSIYLWHWPLVVVIYYFSLNEKFMYLGILLSIFLGFLSYKYIETIRFKNDLNGVRSCFRYKPLYMVFTIGLLGTITFKEDGFIKLTPIEYQSLMYNARPSPYRSKCHINEYQDPANSCEYFGGDITWAVFGDSHSVEIAYALADRLKVKGFGVKHFTFSGCKPSYKEQESFSLCSKWYNDTIAYILADNKIKNVVINHRFTSGLFGGDAADYPSKFNSIETDELKLMQTVKHFDELIALFAENKDKVYVYYPIPELQRSIGQLIGRSYTNNNESLLNVVGTDFSWYKERNKYIVDHFDRSSYPSNVHLLRTSDVFCDDVSCYAVKNGVPLYFDDDHPSVLGAKQLVELIK
ncbi:acyltransferase [Pseudoalteromonas sp. SR41-8]|uniref:acyltransferase family protein n=1 Tax=Pseudoalteromonas sp. SR41-8 TaxID=2760946 RepID=UPI001601DB5C|nr:acyltransferase family protein [Pseudoalteromonas sp. SR41-8]MBB1311789.1 acyltransferase [Pseudoalteromonas sp. SR41-8]